MTEYRRVRIRGSDVQWPDYCACCCVPEPGEVRNLARSEKVYFSLGVRTEWVTCRSTFEAPLCRECKRHITAEETNPLLYGLVVVPGIVVPVIGYQLAGEWLAGALVRWAGLDQLLADDLSLGFFIVAGIVWTLFLMLSLATWLANKEIAEGRPHVSPTCASFVEPVLYAAYEPRLEEAEGMDRYVELRDESEHSFDVVVGPNGGGYLDRFIEANRPRVLEVSEPVER